MSDHLRKRREGIKFSHLGDQVCLLTELLISFFFFNDNDIGIQGNESRPPLILLIEWVCFWCSGVHSSLVWFLIQRTHWCGNAMCWEFCKLREKWYTMYKTLLWNPVQWKIASEPAWMNYSGEDTAIKAAKPLA